MHFHNEYPIIKFYNIHQLHDKPIYLRELEHRQTKLKNISQLCWKASVIKDKDDCISLILNTLGQLLLFSIRPTEYPA